MKNKTGYILYALLCLLIIPTFSQGQDTTGSTNRVIVDSLQRRQAVAARDTTQRYILVADGDSLLSQYYKPLHSPRRAAFYSAVLPGLGQIYNREYWKLPLVYAALGVSAGFFIGNMDSYTTYRNIYRARIANRNNPSYVDPAPQYNDNNVKYLRDAYRQYVDYSVLVFVAAYALNIVDATVFGHLKQFDMSDDLSFKVGPTMMDNRTLGISLKISLSPTKQRKQGLAFR